jgi:hypothetical protein
MTVKGAVRRIITSNNLGRSWYEERVRRQRQRDWSKVHEKTFATTTLSIFTTVGMGDVVIAEQFCHEFERYCQSHGDPKLGRIVLCAGAWPVRFELPKGDHNVYWWWSMNGQDDWLSHYLGQINTKPDVVACLSSWCCEQAKALGARTLYLPLAVGEDFKPLGSARSGIGYAGSRGHKDHEQIATVIGPFANDPGFEWASGFVSAHQINEFYNRKSIVLGMTERYQEKAGMVNNRVFEVLASGTPFIIHRHRAIEEVLGQPYPYQSDSPEQSRAVADRIMADYEGHLAIFDQYRGIIDARHRYKHRLKTLIGFLGGKD